MQISTKLDKILKKIHVKNHYKVSLELTGGNDYMFYYELFDHNRNLQTGGTKHITIKHNNENFMFYFFQDGNSIFFNLYKSNDENSMPACLIIIVDKKGKTAYINGISYDEKCFSVDSTQKCGSVLFKVALKLIDKMKLDYDLKYIQLKDNSRKYCKQIKTSIQLWAITMFTSGETWYGKYGFVPFDTDKLHADIENCKKYLYNKKIITTTKIKNTNIKKYLTKASEKLGIEIDDKIIDKLFDQYNDKNIRDFFGNFLKKYDKYCSIFEFIYKKVMRDYNMESLYGISYFKKL